MKMKYGTLLILVASLTLLGYCQSEPKQKATPEPAVCTAIANCVDCDAEGTTCNTCEENFTWNGTECASNSGSICPGGPERVIAYMDGRGVMHYHCLKK